MKTFLQTTTAGVLDWITNKLTNEANMPRNVKRARGGGSGTAKNRIMNVRLTDNAAGTDGLRVDRQIAAAKTSESQTRIVIGDLLDLGIPTGAATTSSYNFDNVFATDDFTSMAQQFNLFRVVSIKFEITDTNPNVSAYNVWGTWHESYTGSSLAYDRQNITDLPDSRVISGGTGQTVLYWMSHGSAENEFQNTSLTTGSPVINKYGGLKYYVGNGGAAVPKYTVSIHAVVDFRGRR